MNELILGIAFLMAGAAAYDDGYIEVGLAVHSRNYDMPEIDLSIPVGAVEVGVQKGRLKLYYEHVSGLSATEQGAGLNMIGLKVRIK